jgi:hypothetical protein
MISNVSLAVVGLAIGLAGCFTAEHPLLTDENSIAPYKTISFNEKGSDDVTILTREGKTYVSVGEEGRLTMRFMPIDRPDWYVAEVAGNDRGKFLRYFALLKVDLTNRTAETYKVLATDGDLRPGLRACGNDTVCVDDLNAYTSLAKVAVDAGAEPDDVYELKIE